MPNLMTIAAAIVALNDLGLLPVVTVVATVFIAAYLYKSFKR